MVSVLEKPCATAAPLGGSACWNGLEDFWRCDMVAAYILIQTRAGQAEAVAAALRDVPGVTEVASVAGPYDVIARAQARNLDELGKLVVSRFQAVSGVERTLTCPVVRL
jgi:DNA-binding Lrp family transcriptional regulator